MVKYVWGCFLFKQLEAGWNINEICFHFIDDADEIEYYLGYSIGNKKLTGRDIVMLKMDVNLKVQLN